MKLTIDMSGEPLSEQMNVIEKMTKALKDGVEESHKIRSGLAKTEPKMYEMLLCMDSRDFSKFMKDWIDKHMDDHELTNGQVERMFKTPLEKYQRRWK